MKYNFMGNKADENVPDQDLSNTTGSSFDDVKTETAESDTQDNSSSVYSDDTSTDTEPVSYTHLVIIFISVHNVLPFRDQTKKKYLPYLPWAAFVAVPLPVPGFPAPADP